MSDEPTDSADEAAVESAPVGPTMPFAAFAASLGPQASVVAPATRPGQVARVRVDPGHPDEVFLRLLRNRHGRESHTHADWMALIERFRNEPAHPSDPNFAR